MKLQFLAAAAAVIVATTAAGAASAETVSVKLQQPVAEKTKLIAGGAVFLCDGDSCVATAATSRTFTAATCKALAKSVGAVAEFSSDRKSLDEDKLGKCNATAKPVTQVANR
ncbi:hypothetical protein [Phenylobacterium sp.]|uniref:CC_3452 family protein n=1 Tax=Phenylobacterium sp. TaxID=1871053 RepID=UPI0035AED836